METQNQLPLYGHECFSESLSTSQEHPLHPSSSSITHSALNSNYVYQDQQTHIYQYQQPPIQHNLSIYHDPSQLLGKTYSETVPFDSFQQHQQPQLHQLTRHRVQTQTQTQTQPPAPYLLSQSLELLPRNRLKLNQLHPNQSFFQQSSQHEPEPSLSSLQTITNVVPTPETSHSESSRRSSISKVRKPRIATTYWEDGKTICFQVEVNGVLVSRRQDTNYVNGTKLLNVAGMSRGKRDGILKAEKKKYVVRVGAMKLKGFGFHLRGLLKLQETKVLTPCYIHYLLQILKNSSSIKALK